MIENTCGVDVRLLIALIIVALVGMAITYTVGRLTEQSKTQPRIDLSEWERTSRRGEG